MDMILKTVAVAAAILAASADLTCRETGQASPDGTYKYAEKGFEDLFMDIYYPDAGSATADLDGNAKPVVIFMFGGGFFSGERDNPAYARWFDALTANGYMVVSIDYRLGLKGSDKAGIAQVNLIDNAIHMAVEDLFSATEFLLYNADVLEIDPDSIVISGSSAGAIAVLQADYELSNGSPCAEVLPVGFRYAGVMAFSGAILTRDWGLRYKTPPAPVLLLHGTEDRIVNYGQIRFFNLGLYGADKIAKRFRKEGYLYNIIRFAGHGHEIAGCMYETLPYQLHFLEENIMAGSRKVIDATVDDPAIPSGEGGSRTRKELYGGN